MSKRLYSDSIYSITKMSPEEHKLIREAIRGEFEGGKYLRDIGTQALSGAAGGAMMGGAPGALAGAAGGAAWGLGSNAAADIWYQTRSNEEKAAWQAADIQAKLQQMGSLLAGKIDDAQIKNIFDKLGMQYKNFIDVNVAKYNDKDQQAIYQESVFNPQSKAQQAFNRDFTLPKQARIYKKIIRTAAETSSPGAVGGLGASAITDKLLYQYITRPNSLPSEVTRAIQLHLVKNPDVKNMFADIQKLIKQAKTPNPKFTMPDTLPGSMNQWAKGSPKDYLGHNPYDVYNLNPDGTDDLTRVRQEYKDIAVLRAEQAEQAEQAALKQSKSLLQPQNLLKLVGKGVAGLGATAVVDLASNWMLDKINMTMTGGEINMFRQELNEIGKIITEINRLTANNKDVVYAGNILWTNIKHVDKVLAESAQQKVQVPKIPDPTQNPNQIQTQTPNQAQNPNQIPGVLPPVPSSSEQINDSNVIVSSKEIKFKRV